MKLPCLRSDNLLMSVLILFFLTFTSNPYAGATHSCDDGHFVPDVPRVYTGSRKGRYYITGSIVKRCTIGRCHYEVVQPVIYDVMSGRQLRKGEVESKQVSE